MVEIRVAGSTEQAWVAAATTMHRVGGQSAEAMVSIVGAGSLEPVEERLHVVVSPGKVWLAKNTRWPHPRRSTPSWRRNRRRP